MAVRSPLIAAMRALAAVLLLQSAAYAQDVSCPARGPIRGHKTLDLGPKSKGQAASKAYVMRIKGTDGTADYSRSCKPM